MTPFRERSRANLQSCDRYGNSSFIFKRRKEGFFGSYKILLFDSGGVTVVY